jgi:glycerol-3-phosphate acyltransferase PlsX
MSKNIGTIAVDAMGGDNAPFKTLKGIEIFSKKNLYVDLVILGNEAQINNTINQNNIKIQNFEIIHTDQDIHDEDTTNTILRNRKNSSIFKGLDFIKNNRNFGFVSAGNTAALMILSRMQLGMIQGIDRPAICSIIPNKKDFSILLDLGANISVNAKNMFEFAIMGYSYFSILKPNKNPSIGIINIGTESNKGMEVLQEASNLINKSFLNKNFVGFIEPNKIANGICDIMICDGYTGNIILKTAEGMSHFITDNLKKVFYKSFFNKIAYFILKKDLKSFKDEINPDKYDGATLIGVNGISIKSHGSSNPYAFSCAIDKCYRFIENKFIEKISNQINNI